MLCCPDPLCVNFQEEKTAYAVGAFWKRFYRHWLPAQGLGSKLAFSPSSARKL